MAYLVTRRDLVTTGGLALLTAGCGEAVPDVEKVSTPTIQGSKIALRGYQIVAAKVGDRLIRLPHPGVRILAVVLIISAIATELVIEYLDDELQRREVREAITEEEKILIEGRRSVVFITEKGQEKKVSLGDNRYVDRAK